MPSGNARSRSTAGADRKLLRVTVVCDCADGVRVEEMAVPEGTTIGDVIRLSGMLENCPGVDPAAGRVGIFNRIRPPDTPLRNGDRVEIYRPLRADPKEARRRRAGRKRSGGRG
jgi:putative ubiquitin-RnfH superfamily antitoxin RatB of RatAB toxin-antitoxin module